MSTGGVPLLSGPPHELGGNEQSCRKCDKEFNILFARSRRCNHCGYLYCYSCTDFQALMPRSGSEGGYEAVPVCAFCIDNLTITAGGKNHLRSLPLARLKRYASAYNIKVNGIFEKNDLVDALISAREPNGCLPRANEESYRKYSVPDRRSNRPRGIFTRAMDAMHSDRPVNPPPRQEQQPPPYQPRQRTTSGPSSFPRPDLDPQRQQQRQRAPPPPQPSSPPRPTQRSARPSQYRTGPSRPTSSANLNTPGGDSQSRWRSRAASASAAARARSPAPPVPSLDELLGMSDNQIAHLSIGTLKAILFQNHVNARLVVEKEELVSKVQTLVVDERRERERHAMEMEAERLEEEEMRRERGEDERRQREEAERRSAEVEQAGGEPFDDTSGHTEAIQGGDQAEDMSLDGQDARAGSESHTLEGTLEGTHEGTHEEHAPPPLPPKVAPSPPPKSVSPRAHLMTSRLERTGLCVICQDEEANIAIVDCGHLCLCRPCSELIMKGTRECPLCRTRIVTEQRLLRIFKS